MSTQDTVKINLEIATEAANQALKNFKKTTEETNNSFNIFKGSFAAGLAIEALQSAFSFVSSAFSSVIKEAEDAQVNVEKLNFALQNTGRYTPESSKALIEFAEKIQSTSIYTNDAALQSEALLANLTKLSNEGIMKATQAAANLAATLNIDMGTATEMIAKAINGNVTAFGKLGIQIKTSATATGNLENLLQALSKQEGAAENATKSYQGSLAQLTNSKGDLLKAIGNLIVSNPVMVESFQVMTKTVDELTTYINSNSTEITNFAKSLLIATPIVGAITAGFYLFTGGIAATTTALVALRTAAALAWSTISAPVTLVVAGITAVGTAIYYVTKYWDNIKASVYESLAAVEEFRAKVVGNFSESLAKEAQDTANSYRTKAAAIREAIAAKNEENKLDDTKKNNSSVINEQTLKEKQAYLERLTLKKEFQNNLLITEQETNLARAEEENRYKQEVQSISGQYDLSEIQVQNQKEMELLRLRQAYEQEQLKVKSDASLAKAKLVEDELAREKAILEAYQTQKLEQIKLNNKQDLEQEKLRNKQSAELQKNEVANRRDTLNTIATLSSSNNKSLAAIGKAAGLVQIAIDTPIAISKALSAFPPPFNFVAAAAVGTAMAAQAAQLSGVSFQTGGIVNGTSYSGDKVQANVNSREMVLNVAQQRQLFDLANGKTTTSNNTNSNTNNTEALLVELISAVKENQSISIDGRELVTVIKNKASAGYAI